MMKIICIASVISLSVAVSVSVSVNTTAPFLILPRTYLGFGLDWWPPYQEGFGTSTVNLINLTNSRLIGLTRALGPVTLRIGGSLDNVVKYLIGNMSRAECEAPVTFRGESWPNLCLNMSRWREVIDFVGGGGGLAPGSRLVFGLQLDLSEDGPWNSSNVLDFLAATASFPGSDVISAFEVGEETNPTPGTPVFQGQIDAYRGIHRAVASLWPGANRPMVVGPCSGMNENSAPFTWSDAFITAAGDALDAYVMHSYNNDGGDAWTKPGFLAQTGQQAVGIRSFLNDFAASSGTPPLPLLCGECGPHNGGGLRNVTTRAISSFWYTDAMHSLPILGVTQFNRQDLAGASYGLLENDSFEPNPDYFAALAYATLSGPRILATVTTSDENVTASLRVYASCSPSGNGGVSVVYNNVNMMMGFNLTLDGVAPGRKTVFAFSPTNGDIFSSQLSLNGVPLVVTGDVPVPFVGADSDAMESVPVPPLTFGYALYHDMKAAACYAT